MFHDKTKGSSKKAGEARQKVRGRESVGAGRGKGVEGMKGGGRTAA